MEEEWESKKLSVMSLICTIPLTASGVNIYIYPHLLAENINKNMWKDGERRF